MKKLIKNILITVILLPLFAIAKDFTLVELQQRYDRMQVVLEDTVTFYDRKIDNLKATAAFNSLITEQQKLKSKKIKSINAEIKKIAILIDGNISSVQDFLYLDTGKANRNHRFARKEYWIKKYVDKDLEDLKRFCGLDYLNFSNNITYSSRHVLKKVEHKSPNCRKVSGDLGDFLVEKYPRFIKNFNNYIKREAVESTSPYSHQYKTNGDVTILTAILMPLIKNPKLIDEYFHKYIEAEYKKKSLTYSVANPVADFYMRYLELSVKAIIDQKIEEYKSVGCCLDSNVDIKEEDKQEFAELTTAYNQALEELKEIKGYIEKDNLIHFSDKEGNIKLPLVNKKTRKVENMIINVTPIMNEFYSHLRRQI
jgi:hypothetical protein